MWDDVQALRKLTNALFGLSALLVLYGVLHYAIHLPVFTLRAVQLSAVPQRVDMAQIAEVVHHQVSGNFFTVDLGQVRRAFEQLPWVRKASVRRLFPWQLEVTLEEQVALAHWNGTELVNGYGEVFIVDRQEANDLPSFTGPEELAPEVVRNYASFNERLAPLGQQVAQINLSQRGAWQLRLQSGMVVELGREQIEERLARFVAAYPVSLAEQRSQARYVDMRYRNGFAAGLAG